MLFAPRIYQCTFLSFGFTLSTLLMSLYFCLLQAVITQLSEQITTLTERLDDFTSRIEEISSIISTTNASSSQQNLAVQAESYNGTAHSALFMAGNGAMNGTLLPSSASSSQLARESPIMEEVRHANLFSRIYFRKKVTV